MNVTFAENSNTTFADLLKEYETPLPRRGEILEGEILRIEEDKGRPPDGRRKARRM
jgi:hypothetical protein